MKPVKQGQYTHAQLVELIDEERAKNCELRADLEHHVKGWKACVVENNQLRAQVERLRAELFECQLELDAAGSLSRAMSAAKTLKETPAQSLAEIEAAALERLKSRLESNQCATAVWLDHEAALIRQQSRES